MYAGKPTPGNDRGYGRAYDQSLLWQNRIIFKYDKMTASQAVIFICLFAKITKNLTACKLSPASAKCFIQAN